jgi:glycosyltransferase involved in cell wall biosynthesis
MRVLFISRAYPPHVGGMQRFASDFYINYLKIGEIELLANTGGVQRTIPFFFRVFFFLLSKSRRYNVIHIYDAVLSPIIPVIRLFSNAKVSFTVNGLDIVYSHFGYQKIILPFLKDADRIIAISQYTREQCVIRGIPNEKLKVIPMGINLYPLDIYSEITKSGIISKFNIPVRGKKILLTVGRLVKRKGHQWFVANVMTALPDNYIYLIAGLGPEKKAITSLVHEMDLVDRVFLLGQVSEEEKNCLFQISDLFIMPNVSVKNDQEGFGVVLLEANKYGLPVIASNIEGIKDVIIDRKTGRLIEERNADGFVNAIINPEINHSPILKEVLSDFDWINIVKRYYDEFETMIAI